jgi:phosphoglycolate phosphatase-like HAD superfamily hydrolase
MSDLARQLFPDDIPAKTLGLIVDLDETICTDFSVPILSAIDVLCRIDRQRVTVHYVTARTETSRAGTDRFIMDHKLPGWRNLHFCPSWQGSRRHKTDIHVRLAREHSVIASIGDTHEDEGEAAREAGVAFILVERGNADPAWAALADLIAAAKGFVEGNDSISEHKKVLRD